MYHSSNTMYHSCFTVLCRSIVWLWNLMFMLQNEGLDGKKKTICDMCIRFYIFEVVNSIFGSVLRLKKRKMAKIWENRASLSNHNISQNLHRYFSLYGISCWRATYSWFELLFQALRHSSTVLDVFKGPKIYGSMLFWNDTF